MIKIPIFKLVLVVITIALIGGAAYGGWKMLQNTERDVEQGSSTAPESKKYTYAWGPEQQDIIPGELRLDLSFLYEKETEKVSFAIEINDDDYNDWDFLVMVFDKSQNGVIDLGPSSCPQKNSSVMSSS